VDRLKPVCDTNILIDFLAGKEPAKVELARYPKCRISIITWIEVMVGARGQDEESSVREFLNSFETVPLDEKVAETAVQLRRQYGLKLPDTLIWASAKTTESLLITRNTRDYPAGEPDIRFPYKL
jgi:predicted nucleic acid-binding protein